MQVIIKKFDVNWLEIKNLCLNTIGKEDSTKEPQDYWKKDLLISRHSPIRHGVITLELRDIEYCYANHFVRHAIGNTFYMTTSRSDRTGIDRNERKQTDLVNLVMDINVQSVLNISERRLCFQADKTTLKYWKMVLEEIKKYDENIYWASVPQCVRCNSCVEPFSNCQYFNNFSQYLTDEEKTNITKRYNKYNMMRR